LLKDRGKSRKLVSRWLESEAGLSNIYIYKDSARTSKRTPHFTVTKINWLMLFKEMIAVYSENHTKPINTNTALQIVKVAGTYSYH
jgi:hypothetical protein